MYMHINVCVICMHALYGSGRSRRKSLILLANLLPSHCGTHVAFQLCDSDHAFSTELHHRGRAAPRAATRPSRILHRENGPLRRPRLCAWCSRLHVLLHRAIRREWPLTCPLPRPPWPSAPAPHPAPPLPSTAVRVWFQLSHQGD